MHVNNINVKKLKKYNDISQENRDKALGELRLRISSLYKSNVCFTLITLESKL